MQTRYQIRKFGEDHVMIQWAFAASDYEPGDCLVVVDPAGTECDVDWISPGYLDPMTLEEIRAYIAADTRVLGFLIHDCRGIVLDGEMILFDNPVQVRNHDGRETA